MTLKNKTINYPNMKRITTVCFVLFLMVSIGTQAQKKTLKEAISIANFSAEESESVKKIKRAENAEIKKSKSETSDKAELKEKIKAIRRKSLNDIKAVVNAEGYKLYKEYWKKKKK